MVIAIAIKFYLQPVTVYAIISSFMKEQWQAFKKLAGKNTALTKFHIGIHLMTSVDREGIK